MDVKVSYRKFIELITEKNDLILSSIDASKGDKSCFEVWMFSQSIEYAKGIESLQSASNSSSALALLRPMYESFYKGSWLSLCANQDQINYFLDHDTLATRQSVKGYKFSPTSTDYENRPGKSIPMHSIVNHVIKKKEYDEDYKVLQQQIWSMLCGCTHVGVIPLYAYYCGLKNTEPLITQMSESIYSMASLLLYMSFEQLIIKSKLGDSEKERTLNEAYEYYGVAVHYLRSQVK
ncbi:hypothetical protein AKJ18_00730 [Vibrio xuii]|nr:hypothetical protein AKJ18_00730 [Vibrio xuii]